VSVGSGGGRGPLPTEGLIDASGDAPLTEEPIDTSPLKEVVIDISGDTETGRGDEAPGGALRGSGGGLDLKLPGCPRRGRAGADLPPLIERLRKSTLSCLTLSTSACT